MVLYKLMTGPLTTVSCLHGGPIPTNRLGDEKHANTAEAENYKFLKDCEEKYGTTAILAIEDDHIVGILRFFPSEIYDLFDTSPCVHNALSLHREKNIDQYDLPTKEKLSGTLETLCVQIATGYYQNGEDYGNRGIAKKLFAKLIEWSHSNSWKLITTTAINKIEPLMLWSGLYPKTNLESLGFTVKTVNISKSIKNVIRDQQDGHHGKDVKQTWINYMETPLKELSQVYEMDYKIDP